MFNFNSYSQQLKPISKSSTQKFNVPNHFCGSDEIHKEKMKNDREYRLRHSQTIENIKQAQLMGKSTEEIYQVPVVVHVMHKGEAIGEGTNISDADVSAGIQYLNNSWRKIPGTNGDGNGVDMQIEFALAVQDEYGNCTNGINRVDMSNVDAYINHGVANSPSSFGMRDYDDDPEINSLKEYSIWDPTKYYNVWLVDEINNSNCNSSSYTAGYALYATAHGEDYDGSVVLICSYLDESSVTWAHEMGHAFNLPHTFDGDYNSNDVTYSCGEDNIFDTPKHMRTMFINGLYNDCDNVDINSCDPNFNEQMSTTKYGNGTHQDHMHNFMDYTGCASEFTNGQRDVAKYTLIHQRASFLAENGNIALVNPTTAEVDFSASSYLVCNGNTVKFIDQSTCTPNTYTNEPLSGITFNWIFDNGLNTPLSSIDQNPVITFDDFGTYDVTLEVTNVHGTTSLTKSGLVTVNENIVDGCSITSTSNNIDYASGVTNISFHTLNNSTNTFIPENAMQDFVCSKATILHLDTAYNLSVTYRSLYYYNQFLEIWIDWDNSGTFELSNNNGINELVLKDSIAAASSVTPSISVTPSATVVLNKLLRMRVISSAVNVPEVCGNSQLQRADDYGVMVQGVVQGCLDINACNYNENVTEDDGSCSYAATGYDCDGNCLADTDGDGVCDELEIAGCSDASACNYNENATESDDSCDYAAEYYDCEGVCLTDTDGDGVCDEFEVSGCTDDTACNYDEDATDVGVCTYLNGICETCDNGVIVDNDADSDGVCDADEVMGCTDDTACNYDEDATDDDGSCYMISVSVENYSYNHQMVMVSTDAVEATYVWYYGETVLMNSSGMMIPTENGEYSVIVTDDQECSVTIDFIVTELGLFDLEDSGIKLYPNPATDKLYLEANNTYNELNIEVVNVIGEVVLVPKNIHSGDIIEFNIEDLSSGIYYLKVSSNQDFVTIPWVKR